MYRWEHEYEDYNGNKRNEVFYFNLSKAEIIDLEWRTPGGLENYMRHIMSMLDGQALADAFKMLIDKAYGVKGPDGRTFIKTPEVLNNFKFTEAYSDLYMLLATNDEAAAEFVNGIFPKEAVEAARKNNEMAQKAGISLVDTSKDTGVVQDMTPSVPMVEGQEVLTPVSPLPTSPVTPTV